jgi:hypothetical protein
LGYIRLAISVMRLLSTRQNDFEPGQPPAPPSERTTEIGSVPQNEPESPEAAASERTTDNAFCASVPDRQLTTNQNTSPITLPPAPAGDYAVCASVPDRPVTLSEIEQEIMAALEAENQWVTEQQEKFRKQNEAAGKYYR